MKRSPNKIKKRNNILLQKLKKRSNILQKLRKSRIRYDGKKKSKNSPKFKFKNVWEVYTLEGCPYCEKAVKLLNKNKQIVLEKEFLKLTPKQKELVEKRQGRVHETFPRIFNPNFIGGYDDLQKLFPSSTYIF